MMVQKKKQQQQQQQQVLPAARRRMIKNLMPSFLHDKEPVKKIIEWERIIDCLRSKHMINMYDRHTVILERLAQVLADGVPLKHMEPLAHVLSLVNERIMQGGKDVLCKPLCGLLAVLQHSLIDDRGDKPLDQLKKDLQQLAKSVGDFVHVHDDNVIEHAVEVLYRLCGGPRTDPPVSEHRIIMFPWLLDSVSLPPSMQDPASVASHGSDARYHETEMELLELLAEADLIPHLTTALQINHRTSCQSDTLRTLRRLSLSDTCCKQMIQEGTLDLLTQIARDSTDDVKLSMITEILWNALESTHTPLIAEALSAQNNINNLHAMFKRESNARRDVEKELRNELVIVCTDIAVFASEGRFAAFRQSGFLATVCELLMGEEMEARNRTMPKSRIPRSSPVPIPSSNDHAFKKHLLTLTMVLCEDAGVLETFLENGLLDFCVMYLDYDSPNPAIYRWSLRQIKGLQLQILTLLQKILPKSHTADPTIYDTLLAFLKTALEKDAQGRPHTGLPNPTSDPVGLVMSVLRLLIVLAEAETESRQRLGQLGIFPVVNDILSTPTHAPETHRTALLLLTSLCQFAPNRSTFGQIPQSIPTLVSFLSFLSPSTQETSSIHLSTITALWAAIPFCPLNEKAFLETDGLYRLLDLLAEKRQTREIRMCGLGFLCDLLENSVVKRFCDEWRGRDGGLVGLAVELWVSEEKFLGVPQGLQGTVFPDDRNPLEGAHPQKHTTFPPVIDELTQNLRAKLYSLLTHLQPIDTCSLSPHIQIKLPLIARYLDFKLLDVYSTLERSLQVDGIRPTTPDRECIEVVGEVQREKKQMVLEEQKAVAEGFGQKVKQQDQQFYETIKKREEMKKMASAAESRHPRLPQLPAKQSTTIRHHHRHTTYTTLPTTSTAVHLPLTSGH
ncbi:hypothetical protein SpCBS45565_g00330 [Spizellomyces sp. 'palustris']|nr:hypothetical protein SpCBS45565_g00330 [Spizellomyces sp. 'palustris']